MLLIFLFIPPQYLNGANMRNSIQKVKARHEKRLMALKGVVSVGIGQDANNEPAIIVGIDTQDLKTVKKIPKELDGYKLHVNLIGRVKAQ